MGNQGSPFCFVVFLNGRKRDLVGIACFLGYWIAGYMDLLLERSVEKQEGSEYQENRLMTIKIIQLLEDLIFPIQINVT